MQALESVLLESLCYLDRVFAVDLLLVLISVGQSDTFPLDYVYGWYEFYHCFDVRFVCVVCMLSSCSLGGVYRSRKFLRIFAPTLPLFSGWNCVA